MLDHTFDTPLIYIFILTTFYLQNIHIFKFYPNILSVEYKYFCLACLGHTLLFTTTWCSSPLNVFKLQQSEIRVGARSSKRKTVNVTRWKKKKAKSRQTERQTDNKCISAHICTHLHAYFDGSDSSEGVSSYRCLTLTLVGVCVSHTVTPPTLSITHFNVQCLTCRLYRFSVPAL